MALNKEVLKLKKILVLFLAILILGLMSGVAFAQVYIFANDGFTWSKYGSQWYTVYNDGYIKSPSSLWKFRWSYNHSGCGCDEYAYWDWPSQYELNYTGRVYAWNDNSTYSNMYGADYNISKSTN